ncbi:MAG TPA: HDOD domain-containing protein, partial [Candidatus Acidoferrum sp.]
VYERYIARQPIFDTRLEVFGYELLFRNSDDNQFTPSKSATASVIVDSTMLLRMDFLTGRSKAFLNMSQEELRSGAAFLLPHGSTIIEITEQLEIDSETVVACQVLQSAGYKIALDGFQDIPRWQPLLPFASFLKVDFHATSEDEQLSIARKFAGNGLKMIGKKIELRQQYERARKAGFSYFQGFFFLRPQVIVARDMPASKLNCLRLLGEAAAREIRYADVEQILKQEPALLYKLLRYLNSPALGLASKVRSVPQAIALLGEREFRRWVSVVAVVAAAADEPVEVLRTALTRAYFCEGLAQLLGFAQSTTEFFLIGLLSLMDVLLARPLADILAELPLSPEISAALLGASNIFRDVYESALAYENADWETFHTIANRAKFNQKLVAEKYEVAVGHASSIPGGDSQQASL